MVKTISDYCDASRKITPDYQQMAIYACFAEIIAQMNKQVRGFVNIESKC